MGYAPKLARVAKKLGYQWMIVDELAHPNHKDINRDTIYNLKGDPDLFFFFRERDISFRILSAQVGISVFSGRMLVDLLGSRLKTKNYMVTAMDGETFGHHRPGLEQLLFDLYKAPEIQSVKLSDLPALFSKRAPVTPRPSSWALMHKDIERNTPYSRWDDAGNPIHRAQWQLTYLAIKAVNNLNPKSNAFAKARASLDRSLHSDQYWWASASPWWDTRIVIRAATASVKFAASLYQAKCLTRAQYLTSQSLYKKIINTVRTWQRSGEARERHQKYLAVEPFARYFGGQKVN
jgi:predicted glycosyl hydrolase (DUF1957 family)